MRPSLNKARDRAKTTKQETKPDAPKKAVRVLLPSNRVAMLRLPTVSDALYMQEKAASEASVALDLIDPKDKEFAIRSSFAVQRLAFRRLLVGLSEPVAPIYKKELLDKLEVDGKTEGLEGYDLEEWLEEQKENCLDVDAMCMTAKLAEVTDLVWESGSNAYLRDLPDAYVGSIEALDYEALLSTAAGLTNGMHDPKATKVRRGAVTCGI